MDATSAPTARSLGPFRAALRFVFRRIASIYFREIEVAGDVPEPHEGGRLFAANHVNALVDPILVLTQAPCAISPVAKSTLWKIPGLAWLLEAADAVPIVRRRDVPDKSAADNEAVFERVAAHLGGGGNVLIFPEGTSHNEPRLLSLRSGAGRMLARAKADGARGLTFQAVALEFDQRDVFRSRALVLFGPPRRVDDLACEGPALADAVTARLREDLSELLVEGETWEERLLLVRAAEMFAHDAAETRLEHLNRVSRRIEAARAALRRAAPDVVGSLEARLRAYLQAIDAAGLTDEVVARADRADAEREAARVARAAGLVLLAPLAVAGGILYWLPYQLPRLVTRRLKGDPDVTSTYKLGVGLLVFPLWGALLVASAAAMLPGPSAAAAAAVAVASPFAALPWLDRWERLAALLPALLPSEDRRRILSDLAHMRAELMRELEAARARAEQEPLAHASGEGPRA